jgi:hypothetical protein
MWRQRPRSGGARPLRAAHRRRQHGGRRGAVAARSGAAADTAAAAIRSRSRSAAIGWRFNCCVDHLDARVCARVQNPPLELGRVADDCD